MGRGYVCLEMHGAGLGELLRGNQKKAVLKQASLKACCFFLVKNGRQYTAISEHSKLLPRQEVNAFKEIFAKIIFLGIAWFQA